MEHAVESDALEERWERLVDEFQNFRAQRNARKTAARHELDAGQQEIDAEISRIRNEHTEHVEAIKGETDVKLRQIEEQTDIQIKRLRDEAHRKTTVIQEESKQYVEGLKDRVERWTQELEDKRASRKRKHEEVDKQIDINFSLRLKALDRSLMVSVCTMFWTSWGRIILKKSSLTKSGGARDATAFCDSRSADLSSASR